jgi:hypothetical protein
MREPVKPVEIAVTNIVASEVTMNAPHMMRIQAHNLLFRSTGRG